MEFAQSKHPYTRLTPDLILRALESAGLVCDGRLLALNSYENRVYQIGIEDQAAVIGKFYRPGRWSKQAILEEHAFSQELADHEIPVIAPIKDGHGESLHELDGFLFAIYPRHGGRWPDLDNKQQRQQMGRFIGRMHAVGATRDFQHRRKIDIETLGEASRRFVIDNNFVPDYLLEAYRTLSDDLLDHIRAVFEAVGPIRHIRLHGDCHKGNILWTDKGPHFVDLDDSCSGPAVQDIWMLLSGSADEIRMQLEELLEGYETFYEFDYSSVSLIESLRTLRMINYTAWIARRWEDPAFPLAFPWFDSPRYWEEHILSLREQAAALNDPPIL